MLGTSNSLPSRALTCGHPAQPRGASSILPAPGGSAHITGEVRSGNTGPGGRRRRWKGTGGKLGEGGLRHKRNEAAPGKAVDKKDRAGTRA